MNQIIVINSSEDEGEKEVAPEIENEVLVDKKPKVEIPEKIDGEKIDKNDDHVEFFNEFRDLCKKVIDEKEGRKIMTFLNKKYEDASFKYKNSREFRKLLQRYIVKLKEGSKDVFVHVHDVITMLDSSNSVENDAKKFPIKKSVEIDKNVEVTAKKRRISIETVIENDAKISKTVNENQKPASDAVPSNGDAAEASTSSQVNERVSSSTEDERKVDLRRKREKKIKQLEILLKRISKEIIRLQNTELSLDDLEQTDTSYIQESRLKKRFMQIYEQLCKINKAPVQTGRVIERKIRVQSSRFAEINLKVERYINNPKRGSDFPDFDDIFHLVEQANIKSNLNLSESSLETTARQVFKEVGDRMQRRREKDFVFEFGCSAIDDEKNNPDPASSDEVLGRKLAENRTVAKQNLNSVIDKYTDLQTQFGDSPQQNGEEKDNEEEEESDSDSDCGAKTKDLEIDTVNCVSDEDNETNVTMDQT